MKGIGGSPQGFFPDEGPKKRYDLRSSLYHQRREIEKYYGPFLNDKKKWRQTEYDLGLDAYLVHRLPFIHELGTSRPSFFSLLSRSPKSLETVLWKLPSGYVDYIPGSRTDRTGWTFDNHDWALVCRACNKYGLRSGAFRPERIGLVLGRQAEETRQAMRKKLLKPVCVVRGFWGRGSGVNDDRQAALDRRREVQAMTDYEVAVQLWPIIKSELLTAFRNMALAALRTLDKLKYERNER
jgi:hypothetical protein